MTNRREGGFIYFQLRPIGPAVGGTREDWVLRILDLLSRLRIMQRLSNKQQKLCEKQMSFKNDPAWPSYSLILSLLQSEPELSQQLCLGLSFLFKLSWEKSLQRLDCYFYSTHGLHVAIDSLIHPTFCCKWLQKSTENDHIGNKKITRTKNQTLAIFLGIFLFNMIAMTLSITVS